MSEANSIKIDGKDYDTTSLTDDARSQIQNLRATDQEIARLEQQLAIVRTARNAYASALRKVLPEND
ncbi:DUF6447 family protein [Kushneria sp. TE3]|uniref:DUF6447 family protein n=1 Tax=Kushneria sp. TE3 TaxID=3449832 RepID=UPI003F682896